MTKNFFLLLCLLVMGVGKILAEDVVTTYVFTDKDWQATCDGQVANWASGKGGYNFLNNGVQVSTSVTGANATSPRQFSNVSKIVVTYCTNKSGGQGQVQIAVGNTSMTQQSVSNLLETNDNYLTFIPNSPLSGLVKITVTCTTNSVYIRNIAITESIEPTNFSFVATDGSDYYSTYSGVRKVVVPEEDANATYNVFGVKVGANHVLQMTELPKSNGETIIPICTGVLLKATPKNGSAPALTLHYTDELNASYDAATNDLVPCPETGTYKTEDDGNQYFKLAYGDNSNKTGLGFYWGADGGTGNFKVKEGGAILCVSGQQQVKGFAFADSEQLTGVGQVSVEEISGGIWNLNGQRLEKLQKGINILNGRKVYVK